MTIVVSGLGHHVAVLVADGHEWFVPWETGALTSAGATQKVRADPIRPVAVAITGLSRVQGADVFGHIGELMSLYANDRALDAIQIARYLGKGLETLIIAAVTEARAKTKAATTPVNGITLFVASWNVDRPSVARSRVDQQGCKVLEQDDAVIVSAPDCLSDFFATLPKLGYEGDDKLEAQLVGVVRSGIVEERRRHGGANQHCGGPITSVVVAAGEVTLHSFE